MFCEQSKLYIDAELREKTTAIIVINIILLFLLLLLYACVTYADTEIHAYEIFNGKKVVATCNQKREKVCIALTFDLKQSFLLILRYN